MVSLVIGTKQSEIDAWLANGRRDKLELESTTGSLVGRLVARDIEAVVAGSRVRVVLKTLSNDRCSCYVLTAYPKR